MILMLEKIVNNKTRKALIIALASFMALYVGGCRTYKGLSSKLIQPVASIESFSKRETVKDYSTLTWQQAIKHVRNHQEAQDYLDRHFTQVPSRTVNSFAKSHKDPKADCIEYAISAAALLSDNGYVPNILNLFSRKHKEGHSIFLYKTDSGYGALGNSPMDPIYPSIRALIKGLNKKYNRDYKLFQVVDLDKTYPKRSWINGNKNLHLRPSFFSQQFVDQGLNKFFYILGLPPLKGNK